MSKDAMKLKLQNFRAPEDMVVDSTRWVCNYNSLHITKPGFYKINSSDLIRIAIKYFLETHSPAKTFFPKR